MNKLTKKLVLAAVSMLFAVIALGSSTFAWFTLTQQASVAQVTLNIAGAEGVKIGISTPNITLSEIEAHHAGNTLVTPTATRYFSGFGESVTVSDIKKSIGDEGVNQNAIENVLLQPLAGAMTSSPVTTHNTDSFALYTVNTYSSIPVLNNVTASAVKNHMNYKLWFLVESLDTAATINVDIQPTVAVTAASSEFILQADAAASPGWGKDDTVTVSAANALRITTIQDKKDIANSDELYKELKSFAPADATADGTTPANPKVVDLGLDLARASSKAMTYYHNVYAAIDAYKEAWKAIDGAVDGIFLPTVASTDVNATYKATYQAMAAMFDAAVLKQQSAATLATFVQPDPFNTVFANNSAPGRPMSTDIVGVEYFIYLDGWDADCFDAIYTQSVTIDLKFDVLSA